MAPPDRLVALDLGTVTGLAVFEGGELTDVTHWQLTEEGAAHASRLALFSKRMAVLLESRTSEVVFEDVRFSRGGAATQLQYGFRGVLLSHLGALGIPFRLVNVSKLKLWATGRGDASKADMVKEAKRRTGKDLTADEADAVLAGLFALAQTEPPGRPD